MIKKVNLYKPLPRNIVFKLDRMESNRIKSRQREIDINKMCKNLIINNNDMLYDVLSLFSVKHEKYHDVLYYNLQNLTVSKKEETTVFGEQQVAGMVSFSEDNVELKYEDFLTMYHEVVHLSVMWYDYVNRMYHGGFRVVNDYEELFIGEGLDEGYADLLTMKDVNDGLLFIDCDSYIQCSGFVYTMLFARQLEIMLGEENMEYMYYNGGFNALKEELMKYSSERDTLKFFKNCDAAAYAPRRENAILNYKISKAQKFLEDICLEFFPEKYEMFNKHKLFYKKNHFCKWSSESLVEEYEKVSKSR